MNAHIGRSGSSRRHRVEQFQLSGFGVHGEGADGSRNRFADAVGLVGRVKPRSRSIQHQTAWAGPQFIDPDRRHGSRGAVDFKQVNAAPIPRRQVDLRRQRVFQRGTEGPDISDQRGRWGGGCSELPKPAKAPAVSETERNSRREDEEFGMRVRLRRGR